MVSKVSAADIAMGFPPADIYHAGPSVVAYAGTQIDADKAADALLQSLIDAENDFDDDLLSPQAAVTEAMAHSGPKPIVLADAQDNAGAGASSDTTGLLTALIEGSAQGVVLALLNDVEVAAQAHELGKNAEFSTLLGGKSGQDDQHPYAGRFRVEALSNGASRLQVPCMLA
jgi:microcystin degradation protein MlrC